MTQKQLIAEMVEILGNRDLEASLGSWTNIHLAWMLFNHPFIQDSPDKEQVRIECHKILYGEDTPFMTAEQRRKIGLIEKMFAQ